MGEGEMIQRLVGRWVEYARLRTDCSIKDFSQWLYKREMGGELTQVTDESGMPTILEKQMEIGYLFGRLANFIDLWGKLAFKDLPILQFEDYTILQEVKHQHNPTKKSLADLLVNEKSTAFEIIKRLIRDGLLSEELDEKDRRIRRVQLTSKGENILMKANQQAQKAAMLLMGDTPERDMDSLIEIFRELDRFHSHIHDQVPYEAIDDLIKLLKEVK